MPVFKVYYDFDGSGEVEIEAKNEQEAKDKFYEGEFENEQEFGQNYIFNQAQKV